MPDTSRSWEGGFIRADSKGRDVYVIRRMIDGRRYDVSTRCHTLRGAMEQLKRFEADPAGYRPSGESGRAPIYLDATLVAEFLDWSLNVAKNTPTWVRAQRNYLAWWSDRIGGKNLRTLDLGTDILPKLAREKARQPKIAVLKRLYSWLRTDRHILDVTEDPTFGRLKVPQSQPEQWRRVKAISREDVQKVIAALDPPWHQALKVLAATGWHVVELIRFAKNGEIEDHPSGDGKILTCPRAKSGEVHRTQVTAEIAHDAAFLLERGVLNRENFDAAVLRAGKKANVKPFRPGVMRHSVATWAVNAGADPASVAAFLGHKSPRTTAKFYATTAVPKRVPTLGGL